MQAMTQESRWASGTYDMLMQRLVDDEDADIMITIFATPLTLDPADDLDAPILGQVEARAWKLDMAEDELPASPKKMLEIGEHGLKPEEVEARYGPKIGLMILRALYEAADNDIRGLDMEGRPWRQPSAAAEPFRERVQDLMLLLECRLNTP